MSASLDTLAAADAENHMRMMEALDRISSPFASDYLPHAFSLSDDDHNPDVPHLILDSSVGCGDGAGVDANDEGAAGREAAMGAGSTGGIGGVGSCGEGIGGSSASSSDSSCAEYGEGSGVPPLDLSFVGAPISPVSHAGSPVVIGGVRVEMGPSVEGEVDAVAAAAQPPQFVDVALHNLVGAPALAPSGRGVESAGPAVAAVVASGKRPRAVLGECRVEPDGKETSKGEELLMDRSETADGEDQRQLKVGKNEVAAVRADSEGEKGKSDAQGGGGRCGEAAVAEGQAPPEITAEERVERARELRRAAIVRFRLKKKANKLKPKSIKFIRYDCRKVLACQRPRVKGRFVRVEGAPKARAS